MGKTLKIEMLEVLQNAEKPLTAHEIQSRIFMRRYRRRVQEHGTLLWPQYFVGPDSGSLYACLYDLEHKRRRVVSEKNLRFGPWVQAGYVYRLL